MIQYPDGSQWADSSKLVEIYVQRIFLEFSCFCLNEESLDIEDLFEFWDWEKFGLSHFSSYLVLS
jgi:hypothetical protein